MTMDLNTLDKLGLTNYRKTKKPTFDYEIGGLKLGQNKWVEFSLSLNLILCY